MFQKNPPCPRTTAKYAEYSFENKIDINNCDKKTIDQIVRWLMALMNTSGGLIVLYCNTQDCTKRDQWLSKLENSITSKWIPRSTYWSLVKYKYWKENGQLRIYMFVTKSKNIITYESKAFMRYSTKTEQATANEVHELLNVSGHFNKPECKPQMKGLLKENESSFFLQGEKIPVKLEESQEIEYKHTNTEKGDNEDREKCMKKKELKEKILKNVSAFANTEGGSLILGVEDNEKDGYIIRGFKKTKANIEQEKEEIIKFLNETLSSCMWVGKSEARKLKHKCDWDVFFYDVKEKDDEKDASRILIEILVMKMSGCLFQETPMYYRVDGKGDVERVSTLEEWRNDKRESTSNTDRESRPSPIQKHMEEKPVQALDDLGNVQTEEGQIPHQAEKGKSSQAQSSHAASQDRKVPRYFDGSDTDIETYQQKRLDCCIEKMQCDIKEKKGTNNWYPSGEAVKSMGTKYQTFMDYINKEKWTGVATLIDLDAPGNETRSCHHSCEIADCPGMLCYTLLISTEERPKLICCFDHENGNGEQTKQNHIKCALSFGRYLKKEFLTHELNKHQLSLRFYFKVLVLSKENGEAKKVWDSEDTGNQPVLYPYADCKTQFGIASVGLATKLLKTRCKVKDEFGDFIIDHLTDEQAKVLLKRHARILVVKGGSGTGKTVIAIHLLKNALDEKKKKDTEILYLCGSEGLKAFIDYQMERVEPVKPAKCEVRVVHTTNAPDDLLKILENAKLVIVDDVHAISLIGAWDQKDSNDLYPFLFRQAAMNDAHVAVFFDPDQAYKKDFPEKFDEELRSLANSIADTRGSKISLNDICVHELEEKIRNSREIVRFMQANQNQAKTDGKVMKCLNEMEGDGVTYKFIGDTYEENARHLHDKLTEYRERSVVVLFDDDGKQLPKLKNLMTNTHKWNVIDEKTFPRQHVVMCMLDKFGGLESEVVLFILPPSFGIEDPSVCYWKYVNTVSSRAKKKMEFLAPWDPNKKVTQVQKLLALLQLVSTTLKFFLALLDCVSRGHGMGGLIHRPSSVRGIDYL